MAHTGLIAFGSPCAGSAWPTVGDWVALRPNAPVIEQVFERRSLLSRKQPGRALDEQVMAANIDVLFIVSGLDGDYNPRRIERYLALAAESGAGGMRRRTTRIGSPRAAWPPRASIRTRSRATAWKSASCSASSTT